MSDGVARVGDDALAPLEVEAADPRPGLAAVGRAERRLVEAAGVEDLRVARVDGHVVDVLGLAQDVPPRRARVRRHEDAAARVAVGVRDAPGREVEALRVRGIDREAVRAVRARRAARRASSARRRRSSGRARRRRRRRCARARCGAPRRGRARRRRTASAATRTAGSGGSGARPSLRSAHVFPPSVDL